MRPQKSAGNPRSSPPTRILMKDSNRFSFGSAFGAPLLGTLWIPINDGYSAYLTAPTSPTVAYRDLAANS